MPELPEVETIRRQLAPALAGERIARLEVLDPMWCEPADPGRISARVSGRRIECLDRRGKYLLLALEGDLHLTMHLRMTGNLVLVDPPPLADPPHLRMRSRLKGGAELRFNDPRRFGRGILIEGAAALDAYLDARLGVEPLSEQFTPDVLAGLARGRSAPLKSFLLVQAGIAGIGNIYADEALFRARLHPLSPAGSMREGHCRQLHAAIVAALEAGLANGGASIDDYVDARGLPGAMQDELLVHRRAGAACVVCGTEVRRIVVGGRSTHFCPSCQRRLRKRPKSARRRPSTAPATPPSPA